MITILSFTCLPPWQTLFSTNFDVLMLLNIFGRRHFDGSDIYKVRLEIELPVAYFKDWTQTTATIKSNETKN